MRVAPRTAAHLGPAVLALAFGLALGPADSAEPGAQPPPLPMPPGAVVFVSTEPELQRAVQALESNTTVVLAPGTYWLTNTLHVSGPLANVSIRGATASASDVILVGRGQGNENFEGVPHGIATGGPVRGLTVANLTIRDVYAHAIMLDAGAESPRLYNVVLVNAGRSLVRVLPDARGGVEAGVVEHSVFEFTSPGGTDIGGLEVAGGAGWTVRDSTFRSIQAAGERLAGPAVLMAAGARNPVIERNRFVDCQREIVLGLEEKTPNDHTGGIVRNNFIVRAPTVGGGPAIQLADSPGTRILHNTVLLNGTSRTAIEVRYRDTSGVVIRNNLLDADISAKDGAVGAITGNHTKASPGLFVQASSGNLHLVPGAAEVIDRIPAIDEAGSDIDGDSRPVGAAAEYGADEVTFRAAGGPDSGRDRIVTSEPGGTVARVPPSTREARTAATAPEVSITAPRSGSACAAPCSVTIAAAASDPDGRIVRVDFYSGATLLGSATREPYTWTWTSVPAGTYALQAVAEDDSGKVATSAAVTISAIEHVNQPPTVSLEVPRQGSTFSAPAAIEIRAAASDADGSVTRVEFFAGSTLIDTRSQAPFAFTWRDAPEGTYTLSAKAWDTGGASMISPGVNVTVLPASDLPDGWQTKDIGEPLTAGSASHASATFTITGGGAGIGESADQFRFVYRTLSGDGEISACVASLDYVDSWTTAGVMIREGLTADAPYAFSLLSAGWGVAFHHRSQAGARSTQGGVAPGLAPHCLRLVRRGDLFAAFQSEDGAKWTPLGSRMIPMGPEVYVGLAVASHDAERGARAIFNRVGVQ